MSGSTKHQDTTKDTLQDDVPCSSKKSSTGECTMISEEKETDRQPVAAASIEKKSETETVIDLTLSDKDVAIVTRKTGQEKRKDIPHTKKTLPSSTDVAIVTRKTGQEKQKDIPHTKKTLPSSTIQPSSSVRSRRERPKQKAQATVPKKDDQTKPQRRVVQQSIRDHFPVRRSTRRCKSDIETEKFEHVVYKLKNKIEDGLEAVDVEGKGRGVVATRPFSKGELVCEYSGELVSFEEAKKREEDYERDTSIGCYMYYFEYKNKKLCVDATKDNGRFGRLLNHSKTSANVTTKLIPVDDHPYLCLMAARNITPGEELQYDYGERSREIIKSHPWLTQ